MIAYEYVRTVLSGAVLHVILDRPPVNAVSGPMYRELHHVFTGVGRDHPGANAVLLRSEGKHFCGGNDLDEFLTMDSANARERMFHVREAFFAIQDCEIPVVAAVHGAALGTGLALAASCDVIVASDDARFGLPEITVGVMGGAAHLARLAPHGLVRRMFFTGRPVSAAELHRVGGVDSVVPREELLAVAEALAMEIAAHSPTALRIAKQTLNTIETMDLKSAYEHEQGWTGVMSDHADSKEAILAARERRAPRYLPYRAGDREVQPSTEVPTTVR